MNSNVRNAVLWLIVAVLLLLGWTVLTGRKEAATAPQFSDLFRDVELEKVAKVSINRVTGDAQVENKNGDKYRTTIPAAYDTFTDKALEHGVVLTYKDDSGGAWVSVLSTLIPLALVVGF